MNSFRFALRSHRKSKPCPSQLFQPVITSSRAPLAELDYNIHSTLVSRLRASFPLFLNKSTESNSTYFSDLDIARSHLVCTLFSTGIEQARCANGPSAIQGGNGKFGVCLGAVSCSFLQEIKPYQRYEMWTRVLSWDHKWIYIVTHFVIKNKAGRTLSPEQKHLDSPPAGFEKMDENLVAASALSKCVFKKGRWTIPPETMLDVSGLLPSRPEVPASVHTKPLPTSPSQTSLLHDALELFFNVAIKFDDIRMTIESYLSIVFRRIKSGRASSSIDSSFASQNDQVDENTWEEIECERRRGMEMARLLACLGGLGTDFRATETLAIHRDL